VADVDLQAGEEEQERQSDRRHQPYRLVRFHQVQYCGAKHDPGDDLQHRPWDSHQRPGRENQRHRRCDRKHGYEIVEVHHGHHPLVAVCDCPSGEPAPISITPEVVSWLPSTPDG
jgi:hypothetical protein